jgi:tRNA(His) 5'-end guanylyltransferase
MSDLETTWSLKYNSILAGEASAKFSLQLQGLAAFDCRISQLPTKEDVIDYFRWRNEDAFRNALNAHCYWSLRKQGKDYKIATQTLQGMSVAAKNELLFQNGINFNNLPNWQKRGVGLYWEDYQKEGINPKTSKKVYSTRQRIRIDYDLPMKDQYSQFVSRFL